MDRLHREEMLRKALGTHNFFKPRSARAYKAESVVVVNDGGGGRSMIVKLKDGRFISSSPRLDSIWQWVRTNFWANAHHKALLCLGVLTEEQYQALIKFDKEEKQREERFSAARDLRRALAKSGLKPTKAQQKFINDNT